MKKAKKRNIIRAVLLILIPIIVFIIIIFILTGKGFFQNWSLDTAMSVMALVLSLISICVVIVKHRMDAKVKTYELSDTLRKELLDWYYRCISVIVGLRLELMKEKADDTKIFDFNASLYSLAELGRFYFPNYKRDGGKGRYNSEAYKGIRPLIVDLLVEIYKITSKDSDAFLKGKDQYIKNIKCYQKGFTSEMFKLIDPDSFINSQLAETKIDLLHQITFSESDYHPDNRVK